MNIATERLIIHKFTYGDWRCVHEYTSDIDVIKYMPEGVFSDEDSKEFVIKTVVKMLGISLCY